MTLDTLEGHVTIFTDWWSDVVAVLVNIKGSVMQPNFSKVETGRVDLVLKKWSLMAKQYGFYTHEVSALHPY